jgi:hypothetical protein
VQAEQRSFQCRVDHRLQIVLDSEISLRSLHVFALPLRNRRFVASLLDTPTFRKRSIIGEIKKAT